MRKAIKKVDKILEINVLSFLERKGHFRLFRQ